MFGEVPGVDPDSGLEILKDNTTLEHKGDQIKLNRIELAPGNNVTEAGTLFLLFAPPRAESWKIRKQSSPPSLGRSK